MDPRTMSYYSYANPYYWMPSRYNTQNPAYVNSTPAPPNYPRQVVDNSQQSQKQVSKSGEDKNKGLVAAVIVLAILLLILVIALIIVGVLYQQEGQSQNTTTAPVNATTEAAPSQTIVDFSVRRTDITYQPDMADPNSSIFNLTCNIFCSMICNDWLQKQITSDDCKCLQLRPGSVIADIQLTGDSSLGTPEYILSTLRIVIPYQSGLDKNTDKVESTNIVLHGTTTTNKETTKASAVESGSATDIGTTQASRSTTTFGFNVTRIDIQYSLAMADPTSVIFQNTSTTFCEMVIKDWLQNQISLDTCRCVKFVPGSVTATVYITLDNSLGSPSTVIANAQTYLPMLSTNDPRTNTIAASDIIVVE